MSSFDNRRRSPRDLVISAARFGLDTFVPQRPFAYAYAALLDAMGVERGPLGRFRSTGLVRPTREDARRHAGELHARLRQIDTLERALGSRTVVIDAIARGESVSLAFVRSVRAILKGNDRNLARSVAQSLHATQGFDQIGDITRAMVLMADGVADEAWRVFRRYESTYVMDLAPVEYLQAGFLFEPVAAAADLRVLLDSGRADATDASGWLILAGLAIVNREEELARGAIGRAEEVAGAEGDRDTIFHEIEWAKSWLGRMERTLEHSEQSTISFGIVDYKQPDFGKSSKNLGDYIQTVAAMGHLVRHQELEFAGDEGLAQLARELQANVKEERRLTGAKGKFSLSLIQRDGSEFHAVPENTWMLAFGWYKHPTFGVVRPLQFAEHIRPILVSVHINVSSMLTKEAVAYLKRYGPVGCRDWNTVHLLLAAGVPAFFSGCITTTVDTVFSPPAPQSARTGTLVVDTKVPDRGDRFEQQFLDVRLRPFLANMRNALEVLEWYRGKYARVITSRLHSYLPARSLGADVDFRPRNPADPRFDGLAGITDDQFDGIRNGISSKLEQIVRTIASGASEEQVYARWSELCAADVAEARRRHEDVAPIPEPTFDLAETCRVIRAAQVDIPRSRTDHTGEEVDIELSLDGNLKDQLLVAIQSLVDSSSRPLHLWILSRDHTAEDFGRVAALFPQVSFSWLPCDGVSYGVIHGMIRHITVATMDRLLLPQLLPELTRIVHFDIDALCRSDIAVLSDTPMEGHAIAARLSPQPDARSGFATIIAAAQRLKKQERMARELILRSHNMHEFDFESFNAGIMVLDLERMRADDFCRNFIPYAERFGLHDQEILNQYAGGRIAKLDKVWNAIPRFESIEEAKVIHWAGANKPWGEAYVAGRELYREVSNRVLARKESLGQPKESLR